MTRIFKLIALLVAFALVSPIGAQTARAFQSAKGDLADRMMAALDGAQAAGGDIRGRQSAALIVVSGKSTGKPWVDRRFDLRVDDSAEPLKELRHSRLETWKWSSGTPSRSSTWDASTNRSRSSVVSS